MGTVVVENITATSGPLLQLRTNGRLKPGREGWLRVQSMPGYRANRIWMIWPDELANLRSVFAKMPLAWNGTRPLAGYLYGGHLGRGHCRELMERIRLDRTHAHRRSDDGAPMAL